MKKMIEKRMGGQGRRNIALLECIVYIAVAAMIMNFGAVYAFRLWRGHRGQAWFAGRAVEVRLVGQKIRRKIEKSSSVVLEHAENPGIIVSGLNGKTIFFLEDSRLYRGVLRNGVVGEKKSLLREVENFSVEKKSEGTADFFLVDIVLESSGAWSGPEPVFSFSAVAKGD